MTTHTTKASSLAKNKTKMALYTTALLALGSLASTSALAVNGHYVPGIEGIKGASVPPPGTYYRGYAVHYDIDKLTTNKGKSVPGSNTGKVTALANRFIHITEKKFLGADYGFEAIIPVQHTSLNFKAAGIDDSRTDVGDIFVGPVILAWHGQQWDSVFASGLWFDNASSSKPANAGLGYKSLMVTLGGTYYFDTPKSWSFSALSRYEVNGNKKGLDQGDSFLVEWGAGKRLDNGIELGLVGYSGWQLNNNQTEAHAKKQKHALGVETGYFWGNLGFGVNAAYLSEYKTKNSTEGDMFRLHFTKAF
ncbi:MAG: transporter [Pseudomonas sp.]|nr:transporter [Pseudomonas sp.]